MKKHGRDKSNIVTTCMDVKCGGLVPSPSSCCSAGRGRRSRKSSTHSRWLDLYLRACSRAVLKQQSLCTPQLYWTYDASTHKPNRTRWLICGVSGAFISVFVCLFFNSACEIECSLVAALEPPDLTCPSCFSRVSTWLSVLVYLIVDCETAISRNIPVNTVS